MRQTRSRQHDQKCRLKSIYFNHPSQGNSINFYLILGPRDKAAPPTSQKINKFPPKRVKNLAKPSSIFIYISSSTTGELCSHPTRSNVRRILPTLCVGLSTPSLGRSIYLLSVQVYLPPLCAGLSTPSLCKSVYPLSVQVYLPPLCAGLSTPSLCAGLSTPSLCRSVYPLSVQVCLPPLCAIYPFSVQVYVPPLCAGLSTPSLCRSVYPLFVQVCLPPLCAIYPLSVQVCLIPLCAGLSNPSLCRIPVVGNFPSPFCVQLFLSPPPPLCAGSPSVGSPPYPPAPI